MMRKLAHMNVPLTLHGDPEELPREAPLAVDKFFPGHWELMQRLELQARPVVEAGTLEDVVDFLGDVAFLKQPYRVNRDEVRADLRRWPDKITAALGALRTLDRLDYEAMDALARLPGFGLQGGRAFSSAVLRLVKPSAFGIIDWRNLAVVMGAPGFDDLVAPPLQFKEFSVNELLSQRGGLKFTQPIYERYNDALRELASTYQKTAAEIDLILWAHSIRKQPFRAPDHQTFAAHFMLTPEDRKHLKGGDRSLASRIVDAYLASLKDVGYLRRERLIEVLRSVFALIRDECKTFGRKERSKAVRHTANRVVARLNEAINSGSPDRLLARWAYLQAMVDTTSSGWTGSTTLPGSMCLKGYLETISIK